MSIPEGGREGRACPSSLEARDNGAIPSVGQSVKQVHLIAHEGYYSPGVRAGHVRGTQHHVHHDAYSAA